MSLTAKVDAAIKLLKLEQNKGAAAILTALQNEIKMLSANKKIKLINLELANKLLVMIEEIKDLM